MLNRWFLDFDVFNTNKNQKVENELLLDCFYNANQQCLICTMIGRLISHEQVGGGKDNEKQILNIKSMNHKNRNTRNIVRTGKLLENENYNV